ncbi:polymerase [Drepanopeziza brunnea f. sp. 'multigermtubi' MB_m1]|uniref:Polymerase n=1 Tax=Marssonina brunnea f. sp. multigermtubi (strain MB_m1) TaxID=1072389 RepID=K1WI86_MARBU|nr:polymerase [Drepanopeziza brunnea f. sp. 'multigermtubi' MB_m1]EKD17335.1 polymerase [Drepanopeziza brunnea f. sp. 'multigermtubi' MB_m1]
MSIFELKLTKAYFIDNLNKGFIEPLIALFAAPVLFAKKQDGSFRFCIDFRALNNLTRKDRYPFLLIDKTFARLLKAKILYHFYRRLKSRSGQDVDSRALGAPYDRQRRLKLPWILQLLPPIHSRLRRDREAFIPTGYQSLTTLKPWLPLSSTTSSTTKRCWLLYALLTAVTIEEIAELLSTFRVIDQVLKANRTALSFTALRIQASRAESSLVNYGSRAKLIIEGDLLLYNGRLLVLDVQNLRSLLVREVYD